MVAACSHDDCGPLTSKLGGWRPFQADTVGSAARRPAKNADRPMYQSREAHLAARPLHSPEGALAHMACRTVSGGQFVSCGSEALDSATSTGGPPLVATVEGGGDAPDQGAASPRPDPGGCAADRAAGALGAGRGRG